MGHFLPAEQRKQFFGTDWFRCRQQSGQEGKEADERLRTDKMLTEKAKIQITVAFGKTSAICSHQQWYMNKSRWGKAQQLVQIKLLGCGTEQVAAADNFRDAHQGIVDDHCQLIGVNTVAAPQDDIAAFSSQVLRIRTIMSVDKADSSIRKPQPPERCLSRKAGIVRCCLIYSAYVWFVQ